ncbi:type II secretion system protein GspJ [Thalassotalea insulae]|uniref:Type II secretion system protein J n=1 Tax=Thalassotalea insulae TaxID=2056778 RepID=A0ABQ6GWB4_9GAMM|nr:type II secretion system minor pseudopilin GspJ [Thalassotalea insulae]GLX78917.1 type II secretion system protein GspJ [Thalassotalea insulae]
MRRCPNQFSGFTLIEVLLAVSIFAVISLASFSIFDGVMQSERTSKEQMQRLNAIQRALIVIERDFLQIAQRSIRFDGEAPLNDYIFSDSSSFSSEQAIAFVRAGWTNPGLLIPRSDMQSVAYRINDEKLERLHFNFVDAVVGEEPRVRVLLENVTSIELQYYYDKKWQERLVAQQLPKAIELSIETQDFGTISRKFLVADKALATTNRSNRASRDTDKDGRGNENVNPNNAKGEQ